MSFVSARACRHFLLVSLPVLPVLVACNAESLPPEPLPDPGELDLTIQVRAAKDTASGGDTVQFTASRSGTDADSLPLDSLVWDVSPPQATLVEGRLDSSLWVIALDAEQIQVRARLGPAADTAHLAVRRVPGRFVFAGWTASNGVAVGPDGTVYLTASADGGEPGRLFALDPDLTRVWEMPVPAVQIMAPTVGGDGTIFVSGTGAARAFDPAGNVLWTDSTMGDDETAMPLDAAGNAYLAARPPTGGIAVVRFGPGGQATTLFSDTLQTKTPPVIAADTVLVVPTFTTLLGISLSGAPMWGTPLPSRSKWWGPAVAGDGRTVYVPTRNHLVAVDATSGSVLNTFPFPLDGTAPPLAPLVDTDGTVYVQTGQRLIALRPDFSVKWEADSLGGGHNLLSGAGPVLAADGTLFAGRRNDIVRINTADGSVAGRYEIPFEPGTGPGPLMLTPDSALVFVTRRSALGPVYVFKVPVGTALASAPWPVDGGDLARSRRWRAP